MQQSFLGRLLHLADPTLPIGGYTHSNGLETYVQIGKVYDKASADQYVRHYLWYNLKYNDAALMKLAYEATIVAQLEDLILLDQECNALKAPMEIRLASQKLGLRLYKIFSRYHQENSLVQAWGNHIKSKAVYNHYCIMYGFFAAIMKIPLVEAMHAFYYNAAIGVVTNAVKLVPLGQLDGQDILYELHDDLLQLSEESLQMDRSLIGLCTIGFDIRSMQHERLYSRLYLS
ncbi:urease accessory protein UreF [Myroides sp. 1354]|uniref:urease accessory protein UreF n=1 Tax=unclassified Myroides TaxID=2642485 RepID=UPI0025772CCE|nr:MULTISPECIES: urease accessory protein UreF [unclassified Myroides]MDM1044669.1 urease accessory protein UreF [Myroides sp. R163-1]MDM1055382.1 urease accessory protein UreF [Myroides sp. 1354]MDM1068679.1 urease accessory protein UreF [Myroides sp. 1372]